MRTLESIRVWDRSCRLAVHIYRSLDRCDDVQLRESTARSCLEIAANIAASYERAGLSDRCAQLDAARGTCGRLRTQLYIAAQLGLIDERAANDLIAESIEVSQLLRGLLLTVGHSASE